MSETSYRELGDRETILPGDEYWHPVGSWRLVDDPGAVRLTPRECRPLRFRRPLPAAPKPAPAIDPGEGWRLLGEDEVIERGDEFMSRLSGQWRKCGPPIGYAFGEAARCGITSPKGVRRCVAPTRPLTLDDIHRAAITANTRDDCHPGMEFGVNLPDGTRGHAASYDEACRLYDDTVRRVLESRPRHPDYRVAH